jgi:hypothetical protein
MRLSPRIGIAFLLPAVFCHAAAAQATTEYGSMAGKSATAGKRANSISHHIGGIWGSLDKTITGSQQHAPSQRTAQHARRQSRRRAHTASAMHEDPSRIAPGIAYQDLIRRFGPATFAVTSGPRTSTLVYPGKNGDINVELLDGKVTRVVPPSPQQVATAAPK